MDSINSEQTRRQKILIADDSEMNRSILADMLGEEYDIVEAEDGVKAVAALQQYGTEISLLLLDIVMPEMDGFEVLAVMNKNRWIEDVPVIMISAETSPAFMERAFSQGVTDFISRPFNALLVYRRVVNNIVEFRNGESGQHVLHIRALTELFLHHLQHKTDRYPLSQADVSLISTASALHDIGKISIPDEVLNKPGRLTDQEFEIMKTHTVVGSQMMDNLPIHTEEPLVKVARSICRWHHERWDGRGYPDGLRGDDIPIGAQIVALADVYDALTSERVYKRAFPHEVAVQMILDGQCGAFNPLLLECLVEVAERLPQELSGGSSEERVSRMEMRSVAEEMHRHEELSASERTLHLLEHERMKYSFFAAMSQEVQFEYTLTPPMITLNTWGANKFGLQETVLDPFSNQQVLDIISEDSLQGLSKALRSSTPAQPLVKYE